MADVTPTNTPGTTTTTTMNAASLRSPFAPTWCSGCGNYGVWTAFKNALVELALPEEQLVVVYGVGCSGNMADFNRVYGFHALHGRGIANAIGMKLANHALKIVVVAGDGDTYGEGMNHLLSACRGNHDITVLVHNNGVYGLTKGQTAPTTYQGTKTQSTPAGAPEVPVNPLALAVLSGATYVARGFSGQIPQLTALIKQAILHPGMALVDMLQPCFTFNHDQTFNFYLKNTYNLQQDATYNAQHRETALMRSFEHEKIPIGLFYQQTGVAPFHQTLSQLQTPLVQQSIAETDIAQVTAAFA